MADTASETIDNLTVAGKNGNMTAWKPPAWFVGARAEREGTKMHQVNARHEIIREWRSLPKELRQTDEQAAAFALQIKDKYKFSSDSADSYQTVKGWLLCYLSLTRGME